jgi:serine/threonine protein kinase
MRQNSDIVRQIVHEDIKKIYKMTKVLGTGNYGTVKLAHQYSNTKKVYAIKSIPCEKVD